MLAGGLARPFAAAALYKKGYAPEIWLSRPKPDPADDRVRAAGIPLTREEDIDRQILLKNGVPASAIHLYGREVLSTADEARSFAAEYPPAGKTILVVTSRYHARRARMVFRARLKGARVYGVASETMPARWWNDKFLAQFVVMEAIKTAWYLAGGRFLAGAPTR